MPHNDPAQMFDHGLDPIKGWFHINALDKQAAPADPDNVDLIAGRVVHLDAGAKFVPGLSGDSIGIFMWMGAGSFDVLRDAGGIGGGVLGGLVCTGSYELETTEFIDAAYLPNAPLTSENALAANIGKLKAGAYGTDTIVGVVSDGKLSNENGIDVLRFWTIFFPASG